MPEIAFRVYRSPTQRARALAITGYGRFCGSCFSRATKALAPDLGSSLHVSLLSEICRWWYPSASLTSHCAAQQNSDSPMRSINEAAKSCQLNRSQSLTVGVAVDHADDAEVRKQLLAPLLSNKSASRVHEVPCTTLTLL